MYEKFIKPNSVFISLAICALAAFVLSYFFQNWTAGITWLAVGLFNLARFYGQRLKTLEAEIAALRAELAAAPLPGRDQAPDQG